MNPPEQRVIRCDKKFVKKRVRVLKRYCPFKEDIKALG